MLKIRSTRRSKKCCEQEFQEGIRILSVICTMESSRKDIVLLWEKPNRNFGLTGKCQKDFTVVPDISQHVHSRGSAGRKRRPIKILHAQLGGGISMDSFFPNVFHRTPISRDRS